MKRISSISIPDQLKSYVKYIWYFDGEAKNSHPQQGEEVISANAVQDIIFPNFADGSPGLVFQQSDSGNFNCRNASRVPRSYVYGQGIEPINLYVPKGCTMIGVVFHTHVLQTLFGFQAKEITDNFIDLSLLPAIPRISLSEQLWDNSTMQGQMQIVFRYLGYLIEKSKAQPDNGLQYAVQKLMQVDSTVSIKKLHSALNLSERSFERKFAQHVGISPRLLASIGQFQSALKQITTSNFSRLSDVAYDNGYADQSHFIRVFKKFTGVSPLQFSKQLPEHLAQLPAIIQ